MSHRGTGSQGWSLERWHQSTSTIPHPPHRTQRFLQGPFAPGADLSSRTLAVSPDGKLLFSGGHWDNSLRVTSLAKGKVVGHITRHIGVFSSHDGDDDDDDGAVGPWQEAGDTTSR